MLKLQQIEMGYSSKTQKNILVSPFNLEFKGGSLVALLGPNGVGKSTLIKTLSKSLPLLGGDIFIQGKSIKKLNVKELAQMVSVVLTKQPITNNLTVFEFVSLGRQPYTNWKDTLQESDKEIINRIFKHLDLHELQNKWLYELSDGQLQRVYIARALAQDTSIILLDEPTTHLDIHHKLNTLFLLKDIAINFKKVVIYSTHEINLSIQIAHYLWILNNKKSHFGTTETLINKGVLNQLFKGHNVYFDKNSKDFKLIKN